MNRSFRELMRDAARLTRGGQLADATAAIQHALRHDADAVSAAPSAAPAARRSTGAAPRRADSAAAAGPRADTAIDVPFVFTPRVRATAASQRPAAPAHDRRGDRSEGAFLSGSHAHASLTRDYKLYVPPHAVGRSLPLVVMLHGCTQDPEDFAAGTGMNALAAEQGFYVLYPAQAQNANPSRCWNWFKHTHQQRGRGEPAVIAAMVQAVSKRYAIDPHRIYVAGLSAGGAMAAVLGATHPELFAAVGVHSGLAPGVARTLPEALAAMQGGVARARGPRAQRPPAKLPLPVIVFHGDRDTTVHPRNGQQVIAAARGSDVARAASAEESSGAATIERGVSAHGRHYTRSTYAADGDRPAAEYWVLHGGGHAWSGGSRAGSYTDPQGIDAAREMLRFFRENPRGTTLDTGPERHLPEEPPGNWPG
jgi:poly(hydroxyalkanoate) depolymerase family esterase